MRYTILMLFFLLTEAVLSQYTEIHIPTRIKNPDKKYLKADFYTWDSTFPKPVIFVQTPYNRILYRYFRLHQLSAGSLNFFFDTLNYNYVIMDWRGFYGNKEQDSAQWDRGLDGYDAVEWIASQKWCSGKVGTYGGSALGQIQFITAKHQPPHLVCAAPMIKDFKTDYNEFYYGGVLRREHTESREKLGFYPLSLITEHPVKDFFWDYLENLNSYADKFNVPMLMISGWFDHFPGAVLRAFNDIRTKSAKDVRGSHKITLGPWTHGKVDNPEQGILTYPGAGYIAIDMVKDFFDYYMLGAKNGYPLKPFVQYYQMGENTWKKAESWESAASATDTFYLRQEGLLSREKPAAGEDDEAAIFYDPRDPSPSVGGARFDPFDKTVPAGPQDIRETVESRDDALVFTTPVLDEELVLLGKLKVKFYFSSNRTDTDIAVRLCDVYPDGSSIILRQGIRRARFRESFTSEKLMTPGEIYELEVEIDDMAQTFLTGHRLRIVVTSSNYPMFDINTNTGSEMYVPGDTLTAENTIHFSPEYPSFLYFPTVLQTSVCEELISDEADISIIPNPADAHIKVLLPDNFSEKGRIEIYNSTGNRMFEKKYSTAAGVLHLDTDMMRNGIYFLVISSGRRIMSEKFVILR